MSNHIIQIRQRIQAEAAVRKHSVPLLAPEPVVESKSFRWGLPTLLGICVLALTAATFFMLNKKPVDYSPSAPSNHVAPSPKPSVLPPNGTSKADLDAAIAQLTGRLDKSDKRMDLWAHRIWLLAVANNENASIQMKYGYRGYIVFDEDWKINKVPDSMQLDEKQIEDLQKDIK
jgi:hypothetical protein